MNKQKRTSMRVAILGVLLVALVFAVYTSFAKPNEIKKGDKVPNFSLQSLDGETMTLADLKGKGVILNFWGSWCEPCRNEMPDLEKAWLANKDQNIVIVGVNVGESEVSAEQFVRQVKTTFPILMDKQREVTKVYNIGQMPSTFYIDQDGIVQDIIIGPMNEKRINAALEKIRPVKTN
ncbi:thiol-disulfide oxidoreductase ResA [Brevibacillus laterosporus]|uniref:Thiol-disulfide oxidoreductase n=1 Tax=Brevibacillus laterosporus TaxID=1465 RepID=A0AAP8Q8Q2_BRELA|nr:thiol-disulfide oxidoreductase ResA [Brevibacillus laterosporus]MCR8982511.1 thiol-disulfide oxidoreductase ResA [Brevibacillus laterosporus]MCZ0809667.1 thiol-disulfide oxidoreductase ResA [Brevibacillus laterosporus]MCZ0828200.1 thiol-disulfide oxidoreductase ResA [Brevibacillus laterosporus]MCZ0852176.1 thiol-disulfide oxidoreductase ResA [Brevibacillus laterosporus]MED1666856.1 thiol-disulfide oxidoreductase ResA [Brevibacillus laterosporus]